MSYRFPHRRAQNGAALVVGLILLMALTLLAISGMSTSTLELQMAGNMQFSERAFQTAEIGIERAFRSGTYSTAVGPVTVAPTKIDASQPEEFETTTQFDASAGGVTPVLSGGYSMSVNSGFSAYHFDIDSTGTSARGAKAENVQSFFIIGPSS